MSHLLENAKNFVADKVADTVADTVANMKKPEASITDVDLGHVGFDGIRYDVKVSVTNPYSTSIPICQISYTLKSAGSEIVSGTIPDPGSLKANDMTMVDVLVKVPHGVLVSLAKDIGADWDIDYELEVVLTVDLPLFGDINIPLSHKGEMKLPTFRDFF